LTGTARALFAARGYAAVSADEIARAAGVSRGAMYHHFADKRHLFAAVFEQLETEVTAEVAAVARGGADAWTGGLTALATFLDICTRQEVMQISLVDAPTVLGWQAWRELEANYGLGLVIELLEDAAAEGKLVAVPIPALAQLVLSAIFEAALMIAHAEDATAAKADAQQSLLALLAGLIVEPAD
jgi:AcrR family transcriptional regulator